MKPAKSIALLTLVTLLISIFLPLSAFAATEVHVSISKNQSVEIQGKEEALQENIASELDAKLAQKKEEMKQEEQKIREKIDQKNPTPTEKDDTNNVDLERRITKTPTPTKTPSSTPTPRVSRLRTPTPTRTPTPSLTKKLTPTATPTQSPSVTPTPGSSDEKQAYIMNAINDYRKSLGLSPVKTDKYTCDFAKIRAQEITKGFNHDGFRARISNDTLPYPNYTQVTENLAMTSNYKNVVTMWINSPGHAENMRRDTPNVCVEASGNYYAYEGWKQ